MHLGFVLIKYNKTHRNDCYEGRSFTHSSLATEGMTQPQGHHKQNHQGQLGGRRRERKTWARVLTVVFAGRNGESGLAS